MTIKAHRIIDRESAIYFAGLFDGEGCINLCESKRIPGNRATPAIRLSISIANTNLRLIEHICTTIGGRFRKSKRRLRKDGRPKKQSYRWACSSGESAHILKIIQPFLIGKKDQLILALKFHSHVLRVNKKHPGKLGNNPISKADIEWRRECIHRMQRLNHPDS